MMPDFIKRFGKEKPDFEDVLLLLLEQARKGDENAVKATLKILVKHKLIDLRKFMRELEDLVEKLTLMGELTPINNYDSKAKVEETEVEEIEQQIKQASEYIKRIDQEVGSIKKEKLRKLRNIDIERLVRNTVKASEHKQEQAPDNVIPFPGPGM